MPAEWAGQAWSEADLVRGYVRLGGACLTTSFIVTQRVAAVGRIVASENQFVRRQLLPRLATHDLFTTVAISHLTTSRRHLGQAVLRAEPNADGWTLDGYSPWVTGADHAELVLVGATLDDDRQILLAVRTDLPGVRVAPPETLVGLSASHTGRIEFTRVEVDRQWLVAGPCENVVRAGGGSGTGGLATSALAVGLAGAAIAFLENEASRRPELDSPTAALREDWRRQVDDLLAAAEGRPICSQEQLRVHANSLVLRATQAALAAAKGTGYVVGHSAGRWCRESLFFLVWSCPQSVVAANLCELAGLG